jgi:hypothetical protein
LFALRSWVRPLSRNSWVAAVSLHISVMGTRVLSRFNLTEFYLALIFLVFVGPLLLGIVTMFARRSHLRVVAARVATVAFWKLLELIESYFFG